MPASPPNTFSELYSAYAAGCLDPAFTLMVETQSVLRPEIRESVAFSEMISGTLLESAAEAKLSDGKGAPFTYVGKARYRSHKGSAPMSVVLEI